MFIESQGAEVWKSVKSGPYILTLLVNCVSQRISEDKCNDDDKKEILLDKKDKNILASSFGMDGLFRVFIIQTTNEIWETLEVTHKSTEK